jgi:hypothetical protein
MLVNLIRRLKDHKQRVNKNKSFLARVNKKQKVEIDSAASYWGQGKYMKCVNFPWPPFEAALSILNFVFLLKNNVLIRN